jgi:hypothetical protein
MDIIDGSGLWVITIGGMDWLCATAAIVGDTQHADLTATWPAAVIHEDETNMFLTTDVPQSAISADTYRTEVTKCL